MINFLCEEDGATVVEYVLIGFMLICALSTVVFAAWLLYVMVKVTMML